MKNRDDKQKDLDALRKDLESAKNLFVTGFEKIKVSQDFELRKIVRAAGGSYKVIKNNVAGKAAEGMAAEAVLKDLKGMCSLAYTASDPVALSKEEIFSKLLFLMNAPAQRLVTAMNAVGRNLAVVVGQGVKENKFKA